MDTLVPVANIEPSIYGRSCRARSAWERGVAKYALDLLSGLVHRGIKAIPMDGNTRAIFLNGASDWVQYSYGGNSLICDFEIAERLFGGNKKKGTLCPDRKGNHKFADSMRETQARALAEAYSLILQTARTHHFSP